MKPRIDEKRGRKPFSKTHDEDTAFVRSIPKYANVGITNMTNTLKLAITEEDCLFLVQKL